MSELAQRNTDDRTPAQKLISGLRSDTFRSQLEAALPPTVTPERFVRIAVTALQQQPALADAESDSILQAFMCCAQDGLLPDGKEAAIVKRGSKASYMPMIGGFRKIAADHGWTIRTEVVYANDEFEHTEEPPAILHRPVRPGVDRGDLVAAYAVARHRDGRREQKVMYADEIAKRRAMATTAAVWDKWPGPMAAKTLGRDIFAELPIGELDERFYRILEATTPEAMRESLYGPPRDALDSPVHAQLPPAAEDDGGQQAEALMGNASAPGSTDDDGDSGEPDLEPAADVSPFTPPVDPADDPAVAAAMQAAMFEIPNGKHKGVSLGEVLGKPGGETWLGWALSHIENPPPYRQAIHDFARVYSPEQYQQALGQQELAS